MKIIVPIKQVIDHGLNILISDDGDNLSSQGVTRIINPFCAIALEQAIRLKEKGIASEIIVVSIGDDSVKEQLRKALASGADRGILIEATSDQIYCSLDKAKLLCEVVEKETPGLVLMGKQSIDFDNNQTGQMLSVLLGWPLAISASTVTLTEDKVTVECEVDDGVKTLSFNLPGLVTVDLRLNEPRFTSLPDIMKAQLKPLDIFKSSYLDMMEKKEHLEYLEIITPERNVSLKVLEHENELIDIIKALI